MNLKKDFPIFRRKIKGHNLVYLDNAATTHKPDKVLTAINDYCCSNNSNVNRGMHTLSQESTEIYEKSRKTVSNFLNCNSQEIVFTKSATEAINTVAYSLADELSKGDEIITTVLEHHSNLIPWYFLKKKGIKIKFLDINDNYELEFNEKLITKKTKLIAMTHVSNAIGTTNNVKEITDMAKANNIMTLIDGAQSAPHKTIDVKQLGCDFFAFSAHKMLGPTGIGVLYAKKQHLDTFKPFLGGGGMITRVTKDSVEWNKVPWKFEAGTPNVAGAVGLAAAIKYLNKIGMSRISKHEINLLNYTIEKLSQIKSINLIKPTQQSSIISFNIKGYTSHEIGAILDAQGIAIRSGDHCAQPLMRRLDVKGTARISLYLYNNKDDIDRTIKVLKGL
ncbi:aminotransferase class V-fold PLP-dependent enzyme [Nanoarchaeota archaeon]